ncbi:MAG TPA: FAD-dependent oxidoreductase [Terracidiphilus sp.]|nr:FAD-dependent oxidoreductase [Terracidiphilus sp.]
MTESFDVAILGAGIVGAACARECATHGLKTAVFDASDVGGGATAAGMGHIVVMDDSPAQMDLTRWSVELWRQLASELPPQAEFEARGTIWVAADEEEMAEVRRKQKLYSSAGTETDILDSRELAEAEPQLRPGLAGGLLVPSDAVLYPPCAAAHLLQKATEMGAWTATGKRVVEAGQGRVRLADGTEVHARYIVNACGTDAPSLTPSVPIRKRRGHLVITERYPGFAHHQLVELGYLKSAHALATDSVAFNVQPRQTGQLLIGSSREYDADDKQINHALLAWMVRRAQEYMPAIGALQAIRVWTGFRAATPDKLPLIGPWPEDESVFLATGHEGLGITTSLATGKLLLASITGAETKISAEPYLPARFLARQSGNPASNQPEAAHG